MKICEYCKNRLNIKEVTLEYSKDECELCCGLLNQVDAYFDIFSRETVNINYSTFLLGVEVNKECMERDTKRVNETCASCRNFKQEFTFKLGNKIEEKLGKKVDFKNPELIFTIFQESGDYKIWIKPLYIAGRYLKLRRGIPQSPWINPGKGREQEESVSEYIGKSAMKLFEGRDYNFFASGREDVDALMLGEGRPFYVEILNPKNRFAKIDDLPSIIKKNSKEGIDVLVLHFANRDEIESLKRAKFDKVYEVGVFTDQIFDKNVEIVINTLSNLEIEQRTPSRVLGIRKDIVRKRKVYSIEVKNKDEKKMVLKIKAEAGTYIKEFITGDKGRTKPNLSELIGVNVQIEYLNVLEVN